MAFAGTVAETACASRNSGGARHRGAVAHPGHAAESTLLRLHDAQRAGRIPRLLLVLLFQRAPAALSEFALPARLQHCPPPVFLVVPPAAAVSVECVFAGRGKTRVSSRGPRRTDATALPVLG